MGENERDAALFRAFFNNAPIGKAMTGPDGRLLRVNRAFAEMLGYSVERCRPSRSPTSRIQTTSPRAASASDLAGRIVFITGGAFTPGAAEYLARVGNLRVDKPFDTVGLRRMAAELVLAARAKRPA